MPHERGEVVLAEKLTQRFGDTVALDGVSFSIEGPGITGILGPNGAGKTTLLDILEGLKEPTGGTYRLFSEAPHPYPRRRVGVVLQKEPQLERATAKEYADLFAAVYGVAEGAQRILELAKLEDRMRVPVARLSGGEAARLAIATAVVHDPDLLFLDEPTAHLDPDGKRRIGELLSQLAKERTVVLTTHDLREADELCDHLLFLVGGKVRAHGSRTELVAAVPEAEQRGGGLEAAFFHFCAVTMRNGELEGHP
ncbi:MAG: ABC transporter ATP-binding protein [Deltaproteobacteria bacterium]|nr:ABC transporter ATP-binding protein [Deltaproteobacteria bacterium]